MKFDFPIGESFASGVFLGAGLLHMLPTATRDFSNAGYYYPLAFIIAGSGFLLLLLLEHINAYLKHRYSIPQLSSIALLTVILLSIHSVLEGTAIGLSASFATAVIIFMAILTHKGVVGFALSINLNRSTLGLKSRIMTFIFFAVMTPLGIFSGSWISATSQKDILLIPIVSSLAAGTFIYFGTLHGLDRTFLIRHCSSKKEFFFMISGLIIMAMLAIFI